MSKIDTRTFRVRWSEINAHGHVDIPGFLRYLVETAWDWGATSGLSIAESDKLGLAWVIGETEISFFKSLTAHDVFDFSIWLVKWRRIRGTRCFEIRLTDGGELIAQGVQQVITLDHQTLRPTPPPDHLIEKFLFEDPPIIEQHRFPKAPTLPDSLPITQRQVEWRDLDPLEHVNNATYAAYAEEAATQGLANLGWSPANLKEQGLALHYRRFHIQYHSPAYWGDRLNISTYLLDLRESGGSWYIGIRRDPDGGEITRCILEWSLVDPIRGDKRALPESLYHVLSKTVDDRGISNLSNGG